ncbi:MAG: GrpB family protein [Opitutales bacterium]
MARIAIKTVEELRPQVEQTLAAQWARLLRLAPGADIQHIGSTSIPGTVTKGDIDVAVRVPAADFEPTVASLRSAYEVAQPQNWSATFASFKDDATGPLPFGVQVMVIGSETDHLVALRDLLIRDPAARARYNEVKQQHDGLDPDTYWQAKDRVIASLLAQLKANPQP